MCRKKRQKSSNFYLWTRSRPGGATYTSPFSQESERGTRGQGHDIQN